MSENGDSNDDKSVYDEICRDFLRNVCKRADRCRYRHPSANETETLGRRTAYIFCHDYQNAGCHRPNCKFLHCTREEEDYYKQTGQLPARLQQAAALGIGVLPNKLPILKGEVPICKDYLRGECKRSLRCKYRHMNLSPEAEFNGVAVTTSSSAAVVAPTTQEKVDAYNGTAPEYEQYEAAFDQQPPVQAAAAPPPPAAQPTLINSPPLKRRRPTEFEEAVIAINGTPAAAGGGNGAPAQGYGNGGGAGGGAERHHGPAGGGGYEWVRGPPVRTPAEYCLLEEENMMLRRKVDELKKQASDLAATNEVLLEQNARFRSSRANTIPPIVTVSQVVTPTITAATGLARTAGIPPPQQQPPPVQPQPQPPPLAATSIPPPAVQLTATGHGHLVMSMSHQQELIMSMSQQAVAPRMAPELMPPAAAAALNPPPPAPPAATLNAAAPPPLVPVSIGIDSLPVPVSVSNMLPGPGAADIAGLAAAAAAAAAAQQQQQQQSSMASMAPPMMNGAPAAPGGGAGGAAATTRSLVSYPIMSNNHPQMAAAAAANQRNLSGLQQAANNSASIPPPSSLAMPTRAAAVPMCPAPQQLPIPNGNIAAIPNSSLG